MAGRRKRLSHDSNPALKLFNPRFIRIILRSLNLGPSGTPGCCYLTARKAGICGSLLILPHCPGSADLPLGGRSGFSTFSVSQFIQPLRFSDLVTSQPCLLLHCSLGELAVLARRALFPLKPEVSAFSLAASITALEPAHRIRLPLTHTVPWPIPAAHWDPPPPQAI